MRHLLFILIFLSAIVGKAQEKKKDKRGLHIYMHVIDNLTRQGLDTLTLSVIDAADYGTTAQLELPWNIQLSTDLTMYSRRGYSSSSMNTNELVWNARLTKRLMKGALLLQLDGLDILGNLSNVRRTINAQGMTETYTNVIPSYCMMRLTYKFGKKAKRN